MLQDDGMCMLSDLEGELITPDIVVKALRLQEGNQIICNMKLNPRDRLLSFIADNANDSVYVALRVDEV